MHLKNLLLLPFQSIKKPCGKYLVFAIIILMMFSSALDEAAAALTRMRAEPSAADTGHRSLVAACTEGDIGQLQVFIFIQWILMVNG